MVLMFVCLHLQAVWHWEVGWWGLSEGCIGGKSVGGWVAGLEVGGGGDAEKWHVGEGGSLKTPSCKVLEMMLVLRLVCPSDVCGGCAQLCMLNAVH